MVKQPSQELNEVAKEQKDQDFEKEFLDSAMQSYERRCGYDD